MFYCTGIARGHPWTEMDEDPDEPRVLRRVTQCLFVRELQVYRETDVNLFLMRTGGSDVMRAKYAGMAGSWKSKGAINGKVAGEDDNRRPFRRWVISDANIASVLAKQRKIPLFSESARESVEQRSYSGAT